MSEFSTQLSRIIHSRNINVYSMSKYCGMDRSSMYKIISGKRSPSSIELVNRISDFLHLTPLEHQEFVKAYRITSIGEDIYYRRKDVQNFLMHFPDSFSLKQDSSALIETSEDSLSCMDTPCISLQNQFDVNRIIKKIFNCESHKPQGKIALLLQPEYDFLFRLLENMDIPETLSIQHIMCRDNSSALIPPDKRHDALAYLKTIFPLYIKNLNYQAYYFYDNIPAHFYNMNLMPCLILTSQYAMTLSSDFQYGIFYSESSVVSLLWEIFHNDLAACSPLFNVIRLTPENINSLTQMTLSTACSPVNYLLQPEACFTPFISREITEHVLYPGLPHRQQFLHMITGYFSEIRKIMLDNPTYIYFTDRGVSRFAQTGTLKEIPDGFATAFSSDDRRQILRDFLPYCMNGKYRMIKPPLDQFPLNLHLCVNEQTGFMAFENAAGETMYLIINETGFLNLFIDYIESLDTKENIFLYTPEETARFIKQLIDKI